MDQQTNVTRLPVRTTKLQCASRFSRVTFWYDEKYVTIDFQHPFSAGTRKYDLWRLIPTSATEELKDEQGGPQLRRGVMFLLGAVVVFFSAYRESIPLLAPVLAAVGLFEAVVGYVRLQPQVFTHFFGPDGPLVSIPTRVIEGDRESFIEGLSEAITTSRSKVYGTTAV